METLCTREVFSSMDDPSATTLGITTKLWLSAGGKPLYEISTHPFIIRIFGYNRAVARTNSHFGGVEEGTEFAISDLRFWQIKIKKLVFLGIKKTK